MFTNKQQHSGEGDGGGGSQFVQCGGGVMLIYGFDIRIRGTHPTSTFKLIKHNK